MRKITDAEVVLACQTLFGKNVKITRDFLYSIKQGGVKSAYRMKAKENHPDLFASRPVYIQQRQTERFRQIILAYDILNLFFRQREAGVRRSAPRTTAAPARNRKQRDGVRESERASAPKGKGTYYRGTVPHAVLQIGQYLYYRGRISFDTLINSLIWQRKQRPCIGDIAVQWGWLDEKGRQKISRASMRQMLFGEKAVDLGLLSVFQVNTILLYQRSHQERLGVYFVRNKILSSEGIELLVQELKEHNAGVLSGSGPAARAKAAYG